MGKVSAAVEAGVHVCVIDPFPPRAADAPSGLVGAVAVAAGFGEIDLPADKPLCMAAIDADRPPRLYAEPLAVGGGGALPDLPLFLAPERHVPLPLDATYAVAWNATPRRWRDVITGEKQ